MHKHLTSQAKISHLDEKAVLTHRHTNTHTSILNGSVVRTTCLKCLAFHYLGTWTLVYYSIIWFCIRTDGIKTNCMRRFVRSVSVCMFRTKIMWFYWLISPFSNVYFMKVAHGVGCRCQIFKRFHLRIQNAKHPGKNGIVIWWWKI